MDKSKKNEILATSSGWVAVVLNFMPGLGVGYIYQRRWKAYWITTFASAFWVAFDLYGELGIDPSDPAPMNANSSGLFGLLLIASITALEAWITCKKARSAYEI